MSDLRAGEELAEKNGREEELNEYGKTEPDDFLVRTDFRDSQYYVNRELSWIGFNERVLEEGEDPTNPLLERLKFLAIFSSNLDEFFMIRVAGLREQVSVGVVELAEDGLTPLEQLNAIHRTLEPLLQRQDACLLNEVLPGLEQNGVTIRELESLPPEEGERLEAYFMQEVLPVLTPLGVDPGRPFPHLLNRNLNIGFVLRNFYADPENGGFHFAVVQMPAVLGRFIPVLLDEPGFHFVLIEELVAAHAHALFPGLEVASSNTFRVTRDADIEIAEEEADDLLKVMEEQIRRRKWGKAVRLEVDEKMSEQIRDLLRESLDLEAPDVYETRGPGNVADFMTLHRIDSRELKDPPFTSRSLRSFHDEEKSIFSVIRSGNILLHHPFDSFSAVVDFIKGAANDPKVLAIKQTLYRTGSDSPIVDALIKAAENGKQVTALVELKARFDEEKNIEWAKRLEQAGVHVVYGLVGLKTHCKIAMVVRKDDTGLPRIYLHLSTGNYNPVTARLYTDIGMFTADPDIGFDAINLFNYLTGYSARVHWRKLVMAPMSLRKRTVELIRREVEKHTAENPGRIIAKMNSLVDSEIIRELYAASQKGVQVDLLIRGICCLRPGLQGISENIKVTSIVGRFLEHTRIIYFRNGGEEEYYLSSADWMPRNLNRRVETMFPVEEPANKHLLNQIFDVYFRDTRKARLMMSDGSYQRIQPEPGELPFSSQDELIRLTGELIREEAVAAQHTPRASRGNRS
ncbi:MAG: polyphosphate kinase 1 [Ignavibacteriae bacterium]|nr:polyphosphate kinase 1 [Ignavibacteriota bacterium]MCB9215510.1 polyphosphate kinase 1 [Ignavibacteria bacterium]